MVAALKQQWRDLRKGRSGHRFQDRYERNRRARQEKSGIRTFLLPVVGALIFAAGIVFCVIPGPGLPLVLAGATLLAGRSRPLARAMDWSELKIRQLVRWAIRWWSDASLAARNAVIVLAVFMIAGAGYGAYLFMFK